MTKEYTMWRQFLAWVGFVALIGIIPASFYLHALIVNVNACLALA